MDRIQAMEAFVRVAEAGSFAGAADQLDIARSAVTRQVAFLEARLGVKLIARSTRRLNLTPAGSDYLEKCREILSLVSASEADLAGSRRIPRGRIRVSMPISFGIQQMMPLLADFLSLYPEVSIDADFNDRQVNLIESGFDLAIRITEQLEPTQVSRRLSVCRIFTLAAPAYLDRHGTPTHPDQLAQHECLGYTGTARPSWPFRVDGATRLITVRSRFQANNGEALLDATIRGLGISRTPSFIAATAIQTGQVRPILMEYTANVLGIHALFPGARYMPYRVRAFVDYLAERIGGTPYWEAGLDC